MLEDACETREVTEDVDLFLYRMDRIVIDIRVQLKSETEMCSLEVTREH